MKIKENWKTFNGIEVTLTLDTPEKVLAFAAIFNGSELPPDGLDFIERKHPEASVVFVEKAYRDLVTYDDWVSVHKYYKEFTNEME